MGDINITNRPWGFFELLVDAPFYKVKRITVYPDHRISYQYHLKRSEHWTIVSGEGTAVLSDNIILDRGAGESLYIPVGRPHRISNYSNKDLVFIEVQTGEYCGEDDIVRLEDDYNRIKED